MVMISLGGGIYVRAEDVAAVGDGAYQHEIHRMAIEPEGNPVAIVLLRSGQTIPAYISAQTVIRRLQEAEAKP